jgi:hypothetical protein
MGDSKYKTVGPSASEYQVINSGDQATRRGALANLGSLSGNTNNILAGLNSAQMQNLLGSYGSIGQNITNAANAFNNISYDPEAANRALLSNMSGYSNAAQQAANMALSGSNQSARELAALATQDAMRASSTELANAGLLGSGAANQSILEAAYKPQAQLQSDLANMQANYSGNVLNSLMGSGANLLGQGYATQNANALAAAQAGLTGAQSQLDVTNSAVNSQLQNILAQLQGVSTQGSLYANIADLTQPVYTNPTKVKKPGFLDYLSGAAGAAGGAGLLLMGL